jgi:phenylacetate-CoA ligase
MIREIWELRTLLKNRKMTASELDELREKKLRSIIGNAYDHVPYYRSRFQEAGISPDDIRTVADLEKVPVSTKEDLRAAGIEQITSKWVDLSTCVSAKTGGSTGRPWTVYWTQSERTSMLMIDMASLISMGFRPRDRMVILGWPRKRPRPFYQRLGMYRSWEILASTPIAKQIQQLKEFQPTILVVYPTVLRALIHELQTPLRDLINPRMLIHSAEVFDQVLRKRVQADLAAELFDYYAAREIGPIAWECPSHEGLHLNADHYIVECLDGEATTGARGAG